MASIISSRFYLHHIIQEGLTDNFLLRYHFPAHRSLSPQSAAFLQQAQSEYDHNIKAAWADFISELLTLGCCCCQPWLPGDRTQNSQYASRLVIFEEDMLLCHRLVLNIYQHYIRIFLTVSRILELQFSNLKLN